MSSDVKVVPPECTIQEAAAKMKELDVGALPICDGERLLGMITDRDIIVRAVTAGGDVRAESVKRAMTSPIVYCYEDQDLEDAVRIMEVKQIRRLVVLNRAKKLVGIVSLGDIAVRAGNDALAGEVIEKVSMRTSSPEMRA